MDERDGIPTVRRACDLVRRYCLEHSTMPALVLTVNHAGEMVIYSPTEHDWRKAFALLQAATEHLYRKHKTQLEAAAGVVENVS